MIIECTGGTCGLPLPMCLFFNILLFKLHVFECAFNGSVFANNHVSSCVAHESCPLNSLHQSSYSPLIILLNQMFFHNHRVQTKV